MQCLMSFNYDPSSSSSCYGKLWLTTHTHVTVLNAYQNNILIIVDLHGNENPWHALKLHTATNSQRLLMCANVKYVSSKINIIIMNKFHFYFHIHIHIICEWIFFPLDSGCLPFPWCQIISKVMAQRLHNNSYGNSTKKYALALTSIQQHANK